MYHEIGKTVNRDIDGTRQSSIKLQEYIIICFVLYWSGCECMKLSENFYRAIGDAQVCSFPYPCPGTNTLSGIK